MDLYNHIFPSFSWKYWKESKRRSFFFFFFPVYKIEKGFHRTRSADWIGEKNWRRRRKKRHEILQIPPFFLLATKSAAQQHTSRWEKFVCERIGAIRSYIGAISIRHRDFNPLPSAYMAKTWHTLAVCCSEHARDTPIRITYSNIMGYTKKKEEKEEEEEEEEEVYICVCSLCPIYIQRQVCCVHRSEYCIENRRCCCCFFQWEWTVILELFFSCCSSSSFRVLWRIERGATFPLRVAQLELYKFPLSPSTCISRTTNNDWKNEREREKVNSLYYIAGWPMLEAYKKLFLSLSLPRCCC